jgi:hypothetical protein
VEKENRKEARPSKVTPIENLKQSRTPAHGQEVKHKERTLSRGNKQHQKKNQI